MTPGFLEPPLYSLGQRGALVLMTQKEIAMFREIVEMHPSFSQEQERIDDVIAFFYNLIRDQPELLAKADRALQERYGFAITGETVNKRS